MSSDLTIVSRPPTTHHSLPPISPLIPSGRSKIVVGVAAGALLLFAGAFYLSRRKNRAARAMSTEECVQSMLPRGEQLVKAVKIQGGFSNHLWQVTTDKSSYVFRAPKTKLAPSHFQHLLEVSRHAAQSGLSPRVIGANVQQQMLLEYVDQAPWPSYEENPAPYRATMMVLRSFHENMQFLAKQRDDQTPAPFAYIFKEGEQLEKMPEIPVHFSRALQKTREIFDRLTPWLSEHVALCHGDFHKGNVLLSKVDGLPPKLIDFDSMSIGDPLFDIVKFSITLSPEQRLELFEEYLGQGCLTEGEKAHFELMDLALLMVVACVRFKSAQTASQERLSKREMEEMLDSTDPLPSFLKMPFGDTSAQARQKGAIYALGEFLKRSRELPEISPTSLYLNG